MSESSETINKTCLTCGITKDIKLFVIGRNKCKSCRNEGIRSSYKNLEINTNLEQTCNVCDISKNVIEYHKGRKICKDCTNKQRRHKYDNDETYKKRVNQETIKYRKNKGWIDNPLGEFKRKVRSNICRYLTSKNKRTMEYLGCSREEYLKWLLNNNSNYNLENHGSEWHIDHVIPLSKFNLEDEKQQLIAFNWRNTMPLSVGENLKKNNKILPEQVKIHFENLKKYHSENNLDLPQEFIDLFAKHPVAGSP
jgi:hypothetical protein